MRVGPVILELEAHKCRAALSIIQAWHRADALSRSGLFGCAERNPKKADRQGSAKLSRRIVLRNGRRMGALLTEMIEKTAHKCTSSSTRNLNITSALFWAKHLHTYSVCAARARRIKPTPGQMWSRPRVSTHASALEMWD
ncbi:hypothetical protein EVAR_2944_1 [Eumeta japonica]|uniref:Uncharacterized protein n=1 Tax=Eumeta variegata TaxID=151549 RepID=A0A4C1T3L0_EUMVA|nr:hypothetical protein EVAR_2944_1 [Eumeta japonica]